MTRPDVGAVTERVYDGLPEVYRDADARLDYPLLRYLSGIGDQLDEVEDLRARLTYTPTDDEDDATATSDLVDPATANARWLPWLGQLLGVRTDGRTVVEQRDAIANPEETWDHGSPSAIAAAARAGTTGTQDVTVSRHHEGDPFLIGIGTLDGETTVLDTFAELKAVAPRWSDLHALGSFAKTRAPLVIASAEEERPAGYRLVRYSTGA